MPKPKEVLEHTVESWVSTTCWTDGSVLEQLQTHTHTPKHVILSRSWRNNVLFNEYLESLFEIMSSFCSISKINIMFSQTVAHSTNLWQAQVHTGHEHTQSNTLLSRAWSPLSLLASVPCFLEDNYPSGGKEWKSRQTILKRTVFIESISSSTGVLLRCPTSLCCPMSDKHIISWPLNGALPYYWPHMYSV